MTGELSKKPNLLFSVDFVVQAAPDQNNFAGILKCNSYKSFVASRFFSVIHIIIIIIIIIG